MAQFMDEIIVISRVRYIGEPLRQHGTRFIITVPLNKLIRKGYIVATTFWGKRKIKINQSIIRMECRGKSRTSESDQVKYEFETIEDSKARTIIS